MKKIIAIALALTTLFAFAACGKKADGGETTATAEAKIDLPESALVLLTTVWEGFGEEEQFPAMGGNYDEDETKNNVVDNAPGKYDLANEGMTTVLMVPADKLPQITEAASLMHGMMANNYTCGAYKLAEGTDAKAFGEAMYKSISEAQFLCGAPEAVFVATLGDGYVVAAFGLTGLMNAMESKLTAAYPGAQILYNKAIG